MYDLLKKDVPFVWGKRQQKAFDTLKEALLNEPVVAHYDPTATFILRTDASREGIAGILLICPTDRDKDGNPTTIHRKDIDWTREKLFGIALGVLGYCLFDRKIPDIPIWH